MNFEWDYSCCTGFWYMLWFFLSACVKNKMNWNDFRREKVHWNSFQERMFPVCFTVYCPISHPPSKPEANHAKFVSTCIFWCLTISKMWFKVLFAGKHCHRVENESIICFLCLKCFFESFYFIHFPEIFIADYKPKTWKNTELHEQAVFEQILVERLPFKPWFQWKSEALIV